MKAIATIVSLLGTGLWLYGYLVTGHHPVIDWHSLTPWWIADFLPNIEAELGMAIAFLAGLPLCLPARFRGSRSHYGS
jgi:hypothetical protein